MKRIVALLMMIVMLFTVCACGAKSGGSSPEDKYVFKSDETQKVFKSNNNYMIFYYDKDSKVKAIDTVMTFPSEEIAKSSLEVLKKNENKQIGETVLEGKYIVMHMTQEYISDYQNMTAEGIESYLNTQGYVVVEKIDDETKAEKTTAKDSKKSEKEDKSTTKSAETKATTKAADKTTKATTKANAKSTTKAATKTTTAKSAETTAKSK